MCEFNAKCCLELENEEFHGFLQELVFVSASKVPFLVI